MDTHEEIKQRLDSIGKDREWLSKNTPYSPDYIRTVLAPKSKRRTERVMKVMLDAIEREEAAQSGAVAIQSKTPPGYSEIFLTNEEYDLADKASRLVNAPTMAAFCRDAIQAEAQRIIERFAITPIASHPSHWLDLCGGIAAGAPISSDASHEPIPVDREYPENHYALRVFGKSMETKIPDSSTIVVKRWKEGFPKKGTIVVYSDGHGSTLKVFGYREGTADEHKDAMGNVPILRSLNKSFPEVQTMDGGRIEAVFVEVLPSQKSDSTLAIHPRADSPSVEKQA